MALLLLPLELGSEEEPVLPEDPPRAPLPQICLTRG